jgi:hypothetical protein
MNLRLGALALLGGLLLGGCATHQLRHQPWKGVPDADLFSVSRGQFAVPKEKLLDAAAVTLEHEPYFHWTFDSFDKANGLIIGSAGLFREVQLRITDGDNGGSRLAVSIPRRDLNATAKIYVLKSNPAFQTAYPPEADKLGDYRVISAKATLSPDYFYSFTYRVLHDRTQVPFVLTPLGQGQVDADEDAAPAPVAKPATLAPSPVKTPVAGGIPPAHRE